MGVRPAQPASREGGRRHGYLDRHHLAQCAERRFQVDPAADHPYRRKRHLQRLEHPRRLTVEGHPVHRQRRCQFDDHAQRAHHRARRVDHHHHRRRPNCRRRPRRPISCRSSTPRSSTSTPISAPSVRRPSRSKAISASFPSCRIRSAAVSATWSTPTWPKESSRLQALQVQQQLGTQSLSIANQAPQQILSLFK
ncbi:MAG: flagellin [Asticcacaulis sp.]